MLSELNDMQVRQVVDAEAIYRSLADAMRDLASVRGSMFWRAIDGREYLIRRSVRASQKSLGPRTPETEGIHDRFVQRKSAAQDRVRGLREKIIVHQRMNRALGIGLVPPIVVSVLRALDRAGLSDQFRVVGTHAMFAYASAARVHILGESTATRDVDLLLDMRKRMRFVRTLAASDKSLLSVVCEADPSFKIRSDQRYTASNNDGFEIDVLRRPQHQDNDPHPFRASDCEDDFWVVQASQGRILQDGAGFEQIVVATNGEMAVMRTVAPQVFCEVKRRLAACADRDPGKARRDLAQAQLVEELVCAYLPQWQWRHPGTDGALGPAM